MSAEAITSAELVGPLRRKMQTTMAGGGYSLKDLTVLAPQNDPFRVDTPARHRDGEWLATTAAELGLGNRKIHLRGLHYMVIGRPKPDGSPYTNTEADWQFLSGDAGKAARWLGYIPFDQITDQRNAAPEMQEFGLDPDPRPFIQVGINVEIPDVAQVVPTVWGAGFNSKQPYKLAMFGEKSSLNDVLAPIARRFGADLFLPTGEISDTLLYQMAVSGRAAERPLIVFCFSDCDPAGWQMPISIARKLQAFQALPAFHGLEFQVRRVALGPSQVEEYGLPSTPLKVTEKRADKWTAAMGVEQTEIDALASLRPALLRELTFEAIKPFFDLTLQWRLMEANRAWQAEAQAALLQQLDGARLEQLRADATTKLAAMREEINTLNAALRIDASDFDLPEATVPGAVMDDGEHPMPLVDSRWPFESQCHRLIDSKDYREGAQR